MAKYPALTLWTDAYLAVYRTRFLGHKFVSCGGPE